MGIHYDYKSKRGERAMLKEAKRKARLAQKRAKRALTKDSGKEEAKTIEPDADYTIPFGKGRIVLESGNLDNTMCIITYGMGVYWALNAAKDNENKIEIIDLRTLSPIDEELIFNTVKKHGKCLSRSNDITILYCDTQSC